LKFFGTITEKPGTYLVNFEEEEEEHIVVICSE